MLAAPCAQTRAQARLPGCAAQRALPGPPALLWEPGTSPSPASSRWGAWGPQAAGAAPRPEPHPGGSRCPAEPWNPTCTHPARGPRQLVGSSPGRNDSQATCPLSLASPGCWAQMRAAPTFRGPPCPWGLPITLSVYFNPTTGRRGSPCLTVGGGAGSRPGLLHSLSSQPPPASPGSRPVLCPVREPAWNPASAKDALPHRDLRRARRAASQAGGARANPHAQTPPRKARPPSQEGDTSGLWPQSFAEAVRPGLFPLLQSVLRPPCHTQPPEGPVKPWWSQSQPPRWGHPGATQLHRVQSPRGQEGCVLPGLCFHLPQ